MNLCNCVITKPNTLKWKFSWIPLWTL
uniref:Uncharacterized protein n=1 Tax=Arundo donax TaxID=35708 RepID=A0A0A9C9V9_ARUDO